MSDWETLGAVDPRELTDARLQLHWAAQAAAGVGRQLLPLDADGASLTDLPLEVCTFDAAYEWVRVEVERLQGRSLEKPLEQPGEDFPAHLVGSGAVFNTAGPAFAEVGRYFADADRVLRGRG